MSVNDQVIVRLGGEEIVANEGYEVHTGVFTQPSRFAMRTGHGGVLKELIKKYPPGTPFELLVNGQTQFAGRVDGRRASSRSTLILNGRGKLGQLIGVTAQADKVYTHATYLELVQAILKDAGVTTVTVIDDPTTDRKKKTGAPHVATDVQTRTKKKSKFYVVHPPQIKVGEDYYGFLKQHLDRAGLFLVDTAVSDQLVLTEPDGKQQPLYRIHVPPSLDVGLHEESGTVVDFDWTDDTAERMSEYVVYGRGGGGISGRSKTRASFEDEEMLAYGIHRPCGLKDLHCSSGDAAEFLARRKIALGRRRGWSLTYTLVGHVVPDIETGQKDLVWARDTVAHVVDEELGFDENMWIENVSFIGDAASTRTVIHLMRKQDLLFGEDE